MKCLGWLVALTVAVAGCSAKTAPTAWVDDEVTFVADGLTLYGTYRHQPGPSPRPAALLISESGRTDRNGDNAVAGPVGTARSLAGLLSDRGVASLRYDKVGTGRTGLGPYAADPARVGSAVYDSGARAAVRFLTGQPGTDKSRVSVYALGEGAIHAMTLAGDTGAVPRIHSLALLQPLPSRYLDLITNRVRSDVDADVSAGRQTREQGDQAVASWTAAVAQVRAGGAVPANLPAGLNAILNPGNLKAVLDADAIDPSALAARIPPGTPTLLTCSDSDAQASCAAMQPLAAALAHTDLDFVRFKGVSHVLKDDPSDSVANYAKNQPLSPEFVSALNAFVSR